MRSRWEERNLKGSDKADCPSRVCTFSRNSTCVHWLRSWILNALYMHESSGTSKGVWIHSIYSLQPLKVKVETWHSQEPCPWRMILDWFSQLIQWLSTSSMLPFCTLSVLPFPWGTRFNLMEKPLSNYRETKNGRLRVCVCVCVCKSEREREEYRSINGEQKQRSNNILNSFYECVTFVL